MIPTDKEPANVPTGRHLPPVPPFTKLLPGAVGRILEDYLRHVRDMYAWIAQIDARTGGGTGGATIGLVAYDPVTDPFALAIRG